VNGPVGVALAVPPSPCLRYSYDPIFPHACPGDFQTHTITVTNTCPFDQTVTSVTLEPGSDPDFAVLPAPPLFHNPALPVLPPPTPSMYCWAALVPRVGVTPGPHFAAVRFESTDPVEPVRDLLVVGVVGAPDLNVTVRSLVGNPPDFGTVCIGDRSDTN